MTTNLDDAIAAFLSKKTVTVLPTLSLEEQKERVKALNAKTYESCKNERIINDCNNADDYFDRFIDVMEQQKDRIYHQNDNPFNYKDSSES